MTSQLLQAKLLSLANCLLRIESKRPFTLEKLVSDLDLQDIISINLERAVQISVDLAIRVISDRGAAVPAKMADAFSELEALGVINAHLRERMQKAVGFRNLAVHEYEKMNWTIVREIVEKHLVDFKDFAQAVSNLPTHQ